MAETEDAASPDDSTEPVLTLDVTSQETIRVVAAGLVVGICLVTFLGALVGRKKRAEARAEGTKPLPRTWVLALLLSSYTLLIPGLVTTLFSFNIGALDAVSLQKATESMISFIHMLAKTGGWLGSAFVVVFAIVIPALKLVLLAFGEVWKRSDDPADLRWARMFIGFVQQISKWACPDMFAYILLTYLVRSLNHPPTLQGLMQLDLGFTCFSIFCVGSTVSSLGIRRPAEPPRKEGASPRRQLGSAGLLAVVAAIALAFWVLLVLGLIYPCMLLRLDIDTLFENGTIPAAFAEFVKLLNLPELAKADVSLWNCVVELARWSMDGEANSFLAFLLLAVFVVAFTALDVLALCAAAARLAGQAGRGPRAEKPPRALRAARVLRKLSMLDVTVVGVIIVVLSGSIYRSKGLQLTIGWGLYALMGAEACHYALYYAVSQAAGLAPGEDSSDEEDSDTEAEADGEDTIVSSREDSSDL